jgi:hypothetical protein
MKDALKKFESIRALLGHAVIVGDADIDALEEGDDARILAGYSKLLLEAFEKENDPNWPAPTLPTVSLIPMQVTHVTCTGNTSITIHKKWMGRWGGTNQFSDWFVEVRDTTDGCLKREPIRPFGRQAPSACTKQEDDLCRSLFPEGQSFGAGRWMPKGPANPQWSARDCAIALIAGPAPGEYFKEEVLKELARRAETVLGKDAIIGLMEERARTAEDGSGSTWQYVLEQGWEPWTAPE